MINKQIIDEQRFFALCQQGTVLTECRFGPKIVITNAEEIIKIFWPRKKISRSRIQSAANRFIKHTNLLQANNICSVAVTSWYYCPAIGAELVIYPKLPGNDFRHIVDNNLSRLTDVAKFIARLHQQGVFFRGIHLGNLLYSEDNIALIDVTDCKVASRPLSLHRRYRNLRHLFENRDDSEYFQQFTLKQFIDIYLTETSLKKWQKKLLKSALLKKFKKI